MRAGRGLAIANASAVKNAPNTSRCEAPLSALPGISPSRGEIGSFGAAPAFPTFEISEGKEANNLPP
ncbi:Glycyl-tRNA synthetase subunit beta [Mesorhizobium loti]|nr:Glycyl-tRNA synthetase subunit beta [Mesorhizobium loti]